MPADVILHNAKIATNGEPSFVEAVAIEDGAIVAAGANDEVLRQRGPATTAIDAGGRTVIPGLNDSHLHLIRGGLNYNLELRWDGVPSLADALRLLREQARRTPPPQWVRVVGGWTEFQFAERRMPTLDEINAASPDTPVFVLHLYDRALLNRAALRAVGYTRDTPDPPGGEVQRDRAGNPTGLLIARPNASILYATLAKGPKLPPEYQMNSTRQFMRELNRLGLTSAIDAGGGFQNYPDDYRVIEELHRRGEMTVRVAYNLFTQRPRQEFDDFAQWVRMTKPGAGSDFYRMNGAGEMLVFSAADFEDFLEPRPDLPTSLEGELSRVVRLLVENRWPFRLHATYDESISRFLDVFEAVNRDVPFDGLRWFFDHAETVTERNLERVKALRGGIAVQHRMAYQGEYFIDRYGAEAARRTPPIAEMLKMGIPVGAGTDATRVAGYNPWVSLYWMVAGKTVGGTPLYPEGNRLDRAEALRRYTLGSAWFSGEEGKKGAVVPGRLADLAVLSADYFSVPEENIKGIESVLTLVGGRVVYGRASSPGWRRRPFPSSRTGRRSSSPAAATSLVPREPGRLTPRIVLRPAGCTGCSTAWVAGAAAAAASRCGGWVVSASHFEPVEENIMKRTGRAFFVGIALVVALAGLARPADETADVKEKVLEAPNGVAVKVRMEGPYTADVPLQIVCYFKYTPEGAKKMTGAPVELDQRLGGVIASLRERGEFVGDEGETLLLIPPKDAIKAKALLLVGLGPEDALSLEVMERVGRTALREAERLGVSRVAHAPFLRDQGNSKLGTGDVADAVLRGVLLAYDTEKRLQKEGLAKAFTLEQWNVEAGAAYFDDTTAGVQKGIEEAKTAAAKRPADPYATGAK